MLRTRRRGIIWCVLIVLGILLGSGVIYYRTTFPYGESHCCIILMANALEQYAHENGGKYPAGAATAEASLSLLYKSNYVDAATLRGMTVPEKTVRQILEGGGLLRPDSCGWQYVPGLTLADNPGLAILWCKQALGHNGQRTRDRGRQVVFIGQGIQWISGGDWTAFLQKQGELMKHRTVREKSGLPLVTGIIELPSGARTDKIDGGYTIEEESKGADFSSRGTESGGDLQDKLVWYESPIQNGFVTRTLSFSDLTSDAVTIVFTNGIPNVTNFVFKMRHKR